MPFIYDNLIASVISAMILLILASIQMEATQMNTARSSRNIAKNRAQQLATWLEEDLGKIGQNMPQSTVPYSGPKDSTQWHTLEFDFEYVDATGIPVTVEYDLNKTGDTVAIDGNTVHLHRLDRAPDGQSSSNLEYFDVDLLNKNAKSPANPDSIEFVRVRFSVVAPFQNEETVPRRVRRSVVVPYRSGDN